MGLKEDKMMQQHYLGDNVRVSNNYEQRFRTSDCNIKPLIVAQESQIKEFVKLVVLYS